MINKIDIDEIEDTNIKKNIINIFNEDKQKYDDIRYIEKTYIKFNLYELDILCNSIKSHENNIYIGSLDIIKKNVVFKILKAINMATIFNKMYPKDNEKFELYIKYLYDKINYLSHTF